MYVPHYSSGGENFYRASVVSRSHGPESLLQRSVKLRSLDSLVDEIGCHVDFVKCDVEGHELQLIKGSQRIIGSMNAAWLIEISSNPDSEGSDASQIFRTLESYGYSAWWFDGSVLRQRSSGQQAINYFFLLPEHISDLRRCPIVL